MHRQQVSLFLTSEPFGAYVYLAAGGPPLGKTPAGAKLAHGTQPVELLFRFPDGEEIRTSVIPDRTARVHAQSPGSGGQISSKE